jgi:hypothetical protein
LALISANLFLELVGGLGLEGHSVGIKDGLGHLPNLGPFNDVHFNVVLGVFRGLVGAVASASCCSTLNSSISASTLCTFTAVFLELAPLFLVILRLMTHVWTAG